MKNKNLTCYLKIEFFLHEETKKTVAAENKTATAFKNICHAMMVW